MNTKKSWIAWIILPILFIAAGIGTAFYLTPANNQTASAAVSPQTKTTSLELSAPTQTSAANAPAAVGLVNQEATFEDLYTRINPSVVNIQVVSNQTVSLPSGNNNNNNPHNFGGGAIPQQSLGSGFVWDTAGHIVTNNHVIADAAKITVTFSDGTVVDAKLVGTDPFSDLAVIKIDPSQAPQLTPIALADSTAVKVGETAIAIGNPFGLQGTMTQGIVSALGRSIAATDQTSNSSSTSKYTIPDIIQTDASINPGNSGGVLINLEGQLIGVTAAIESSTNSNSGVGFAIPSALVQKVIPELIKNGVYKHAYLGLSGGNLTSDEAKAMNLNANQHGALIASVIPNGPADKAGLKGSDQQTTIDGIQVPVGGDVITAIDGQTVKSFDDVISYLFDHTEAGQTINLTILRQGKEMQIKLTLGERPLQ